MKKELVKLFFAKIKNQNIIQESYIHKILQLDVYQMDVEDREILDKILEKYVP